MELRRIDLLLFKALYLITAGIVAAQILGLATLTSTLFLLTFPFTVLLWLRSMRKTVTATDLLVVCTAALAVANVFLNAAAAGADIGFPYMKKLIMFTMSLLFLQTAHRMRVNEELVRFINNTADLITVLMIAMYLTRYGQMHLLNGRVTQYLTFRFSNPNLTALFLCCLYMLEMYRLFTPERWYIKLVHILMAAFLAWFVMETQSRNCLLVLIIFTLISAWLVFRGRRKLWISRGWAAAIAAFPAVFMAGYMALISSQWVQDLLSFLAGEGKELDSRVAGWSSALEALWGSPLVGAYCEISYGTGNSQMHNSHLDIAVSYGLPVLILVCVLLTKYLYQGGRYYSEKSSYIYILGFACAILLGMGEAAVFSGGLGIYIYAGTFLLLANREDPENKSRL